MPTLTDRQRSALTWIVLGRAAWTPALAWARLVGGALAEELIAGPLEVAEIWDRDDEGEPFEEAMITLTPFGAWSLSAEVVELRWQPSGWTGPKPRQRPEKMLAALEHAELVADDRPGPLEELIDLEAWSALLAQPVAVDGAGRLVDAETAGPITMMGAEVRAMKSKRRAG